MTESLKCSHCFLTYASRRVLYSKTPEIKCAANLEKKKKKKKDFPRHTHVVHITRMLYVNHLVKRPLTDQYHVNQTTAFIVY